MTVPETSCPSVKLCLPRYCLLVGIVCAAFFCAVLVLSHIYKNPTVAIWTDACFAAFTALGLYLIYIYFFDRHFVSQAGLDFARPFTLGRGTASWAEITFVRYSFGWRMFVITLKNGRTVWLSEILNGLPDFARIALVHLSSNRIEEKTLLIFQVLTGALSPDDYNRRIRELFRVKQ